MSRETAFHSLITAIALVGALLLRLIPAPVSSVVGLFYLPLFLVLTISITAGPGYAAAFGVAEPLLGFLLFRNVPFTPDTVTAFVSLVIEGLTSGFLYLVYETAVGAVGGGLLAFLLAFGITKELCLLGAGRTYFLKDFAKDVFLSRGPGLLLALAGVPLLILLLRRLNVMWVLRRERKE